MVTGAVPQDRKIAHCPFHTLMPAERETFLARKRLLEHMGSQLRRAVLAKESQWDPKVLYLSKRGGWPCFLPIEGWEGLGQEGSRERPVLLLPRTPAGPGSARPSCPAQEERLRRGPRRRLRQHHGCASRSACSAAMVGGMAPRRCCWGPSCGQQGPCPTKAQVWAFPSRVQESGGRRV